MQFKRITFMLLPQLVSAFQSPNKQSFHSNKSHDLRLKLKQPSSINTTLSMQQEFDMDEINSIPELNNVSRAIGGPIFRNDDNIMSAKNILWAFVTDAAEDDIDKMCMGQLTGLYLELGGNGAELDKDLTLEEVRGVVAKLERERLSIIQTEQEEDRLDNGGGGGCTCCS